MGNSSVFGRHRSHLFVPLELYDCRCWNMNIREAHEKFGTDEQCLEYIQQMRWPDGVVRCPECGEKNIKRVERSAESKGKNKRGWFYLCLERTCHNQFS